MRREFIPFFQRRSHRAIDHAGTRPITPRNQYAREKREYPDLSSRLTAMSVKMIPSKAAPEERITEGGREPLSPAGSPTRPKKVISQAGKSAARPKNQWCCGRQLVTHLLRYGTTAPVPNNPRTPRITDNLAISCCGDLTAPGV